MAVYYKWIKGCAEGASLTKGLWTYLKWGGRTENGTDVDAGKSADNLPHIYTYTGKQDNPEKENENDLGYILTNDVSSAIVSGNWTFNNENTKFKNYIRFFDNDNNSAYFYLSGDGDLTLFDNLITNGLIIVRDDLRVRGNSLFENTITVKNDTDTANIETTGYCEAQFFNATSDKRAKENIQPATYSALDLISKLPVYTFNYKNKTENITGILAQDLLEAQPKELDLVSNVNATGENNDYMSIKNDKLMFVLMKAIQEQQEQIKKLEEEITSLKKLV